MEKNKNYEMKYVVNWDKNVWIITVILSALFIYVAYEIILGLINDSGWLLWLCLIVFVIVVGYFIISLPTSIRLTSQVVIIKKLVGEKQIPIKSIKEVGTFNFKMPNDQTYGSSGFFGWRGVFNNEQIGKNYSYICHSKQCFYIKTSNKTYALSCKDSSALIEKLKTYENL